MRPKSIDVDNYTECLNLLNIRQLQKTNLRTQADKPQFIRLNSRKYENELFLNNLRVSWEN